jgi:S1-C subfamily serine protease
MFKNTVSTGIISGLSRSVSARDGAHSPVQELRGLIQTDAAINPGNSGGPLIDIKGRVIGINAAIIYGAENIGLAIPINAAERDLMDVKKYGRIRRPYLGVRYITIDDNMRDKMKLPVNHGAYVTHEGPFDHAVVPGSPAEQVGIRERDIILELNSQKIDPNHTIQDCLDELNVGESIRMKVLRNKKEFELETTLSERK